MPPFRLFFTLLFVAQFSIAQQRIAMDVSSRLQNANFTLSYHRVVKKQFLLSAGVFNGGNGNSYSGKDTLLFDSGFRPSSPFDEVNNSRVDSSGNYSLLDYGTRGRSSGVLLGVGYFYPLGENHSLRANLNAKMGYAVSYIRAYYRLDETHNDMQAHYVMNHMVASFSLELYHGIKISDRMAVYYGLKIPYYFTPNKLHFNPSIYKDLYYGFEPEFSLGISYFLGKLAPIEAESTSEKIN